MNSWHDEERKLWDSFMSVPRIGISLHGLQGDKRKQALQEIEKQKQAIFRSQWKYLDLFLKH